MKRPRREGRGQVGQAGPHSMEQTQKEAVL